MIHQVFWGDASSRWTGPLWHQLCKSDPDRAAAIIEIDLGIFTGVGLVLWGVGVESGTVDPEAIFCSWSARPDGDRRERSAGEAAFTDAEAAGGPTTRFVTNLTQQPQAGRALSTAIGDVADALANAARPGVNTYEAHIPNAVINVVRDFSLVWYSNTSMGGLRPRGSLLCTRYDLTCKVR